MALYILENRKFSHTISLFVKLNFLCIYEKKNFIQNLHVCRDYIRLIEKSFIKDCIQFSAVLRENLPNEK